MGIAPCHRFDNDGTSGAVFMSMDNCRICFQFREVDEDRICKRCTIKEARKVSTGIRFIFKKHMMRPESTTTHRILTKEDWYYIKRHVDNFFESVSSDDIDWMNHEIDEEVKHRQSIVPGHIYLMKSENGYYKIGRALDVDKRNKEHMRDYPLVITVLHSFFSRNYIKAESYLLKMFADKKLQGEWFALEKSDVDFIMGITDEIAQRLF